MTKIAKTFAFDAAHCLPKLPEDHKCRRVHGHTYEVTIVLTGPVDATTGMIVDYADIASAWQAIHDQVDHRYLNDVPGLQTPTTEVLAAWICSQLSDYPAFVLVETHTSKDGHVESHASTLVECVRVKESTTTWCEVINNEIIGKRKTWSPMPAVTG